MTVRAPAGASFAGLARDVAAFARWRLAGVAVLAVLAAAAEGVGLLLLVPLLQRLGIGGDAAPAVLDGLPAIGLGGGLGGGLALYVLLVAAAALVIAARGMAVSALRYAYVDDLRDRLYRALVGMEWPAFSRLRAADAMHVLTHETGRAAQGIDFLLRMGAWAVEILALLAVAVRLSPAMTGTALLLAGVCVVLARPLDRRTHALGRRVGETAKAFGADLADDLAGMRVIRSFSLEAERGRRFGARMAAMRAGHCEHQRTAGLARAAMQTLAAAAAALAVWVAVRVLEMPLAGTLVLMMAFARLLAAALRIQEAWRTVLFTLPAHAAVQGLLARCRAAAEPRWQSAAEPRWQSTAEPPSETAPEAAVPPLARGLRLEAVTFRHGPNAPPALSGVDAEFPAGAMTAVVGPSGAGKSTLADLLLGLSTPDEGRVLADGRPLDGAVRRAWRRRVGYVPQDSFLFHDTLRANLLLAAPRAGEAALWRALERAAAADVVRALPHGLDTVVGDRGAALSGGERQRVALARALLREPDLLILDEATSALDGESERRVLASLEALRGRVTLVVVAHRASTVRGADRVVVLEGGRVAAAGSWGEVERTAGALLARLHLTA